MPVQTRCPQCNQEVKVPDALLGQLVRCPACGSNFRADDTYSMAPNPQEPPMARGQREPSPYDDDWGDDFDRPRRRRRRDYSRPHRGAMVLTFGIVSLVLSLTCYFGIIGLVFGILAWSFGNNDLRAIRGGEMDPDGEGSTQGGMVCGIIGTIIAGLTVLFWIVVLIAVVASR